MTGPTDAAQAYVELASLPALGPFGWIDDSVEERLKPLQPRLQQLLAEVVTSADGSYWAPSPWHAAIFSRTVVEHASWLLAHEEPPTVAPGELLDLPPTTRQRPIFRGHPDAEWDGNLTPRLLRRRRGDRSEPKAALNNFALSLEHLATHLELNCPSDIWAEACAQHYGLETELLDFTTDPDVAVAFGASGERRRDNQVAVIFVLRAGDAVSVGMQVLLPPPFVKRLHLQRGLFVKARRPRSVRRLRRLCTELRFPVNPTFRVIREKNVLTQDDLMPANDWFNNALLTSRAFAGTHQKALDCDQLACETTLPLGNPFERVEWLQFVDEMLFWLVVRLSPKQPGWAIDANLLDLMVSSNMCVIGDVIDRNDALAATSEAEGHFSDAKDRRAWNQMLKNAISS